MEDWKKCKIGDLVEIHRGASPRPIQNYISTSGMPWVKISDATSNNSRFIISTKEFIIEDGIKNSVVVNPEDLIVSNSATPGLPKIMKIQACIQDGWLYFSDYKNITRDFLYYKFFDIQKHLNNLANGSVFQNLKTDIVKNFDINLPPLSIQQKIAAILSSLDDKIELNNKINENLEQQAQVLFKSWFVDFEPFGGKMPEDWRVGKLSELINVKYGKDHKKLNDGIYPVYGSCGIMRKVDHFLYDKESVLIPRKGTLNNVFYINEAFWSVDTMFYTEMKKENIAKYVYFFVKSKDLNAMNAGSAVPSMTTEILNALEVVIPSEEYLEKYETIVSPMFKQQKQCIIENENLASIRDTLLPKLMNGEIEV